MERRLRTNLGSNLGKRMSLTKLTEPYKHKVKSENQIFCRKTISQMVQIAIAVSGHNALNGLSLVLGLRMLCSDHQKHAATYQNDYASAIK